MNARGQNPCGRCLCNTEDEPDECPPRPKVFEVYCPLSSPVFRDYWWSGYAPLLSLTRARSTSRGCLAHAATAERRISFTRPARVRQVLAPCSAHAVWSPRPGSRLPESAIGPPARRREREPSDPAEPGTTPPRRWRRRCRDRR